MNEPFSEREPEQFKEQLYRLSERCLTDFDKAVLALGAALREPVEKLGKAFVDLGEQIEIERCFGNRVDGERCQRKSGIRSGGDSLFCSLHRRQEELRQAAFMESCR